MLNQETVFDCIATLKLAYPRQQLEDETLLLYESMLSDIDISLLSLAVQRLISSSKWFPTISEIREAACDLVFEKFRVLSPLAAWEVANGHEDSEMPEVVKMAVGQAIGSFWELTNSTSPVADRARFIEAYKDILSQEKRRIINTPEINLFLDSGQRSFLLGNGREDNADQLLIESAISTR